MTIGALQSVHLVNIDTLTTLNEVAVPSHLRPQWGITSYSLMPLCRWH